MNLIITRKRFLIHGSFESDLSFRLDGFISDQPQLENSHYQLYVAYQDHKHRTNCQIVPVMSYLSSTSPKFQNTGPIEILCLSRGAIVIERPLHLYPLTSTSIIIVRGPLDQGNFMHCQGFGR